jgi:acyl dehydratase
MSATSSTSEQAYHTHVEHLASLADKISEVLGLSPWVTITQERINAFAQASDDHQWIHVDPERAKSDSPFASTIAQGFLILSLIPKICYQTLSVDNVALAINYGLDRVRFISPVPVDAMIRGKVVLEEFEMTGRKARMKLGITFEIKGKKKPACIANLISQVLIKE